MNKDIAQAIIEKALDEALAELSSRALAAKDCYMMSDQDAGRQEFHEAIGAMARATHQISLLSALGE